ncbi:MAG: NADH-quinone oxidoreductase subunit C, partial [Burkholderiales bacterium]
MSFQVERSSVDADAWRRALEQAAQAGGRLGALWGTDEGARFAVHALLVVHERLVCLKLELEGTSYPDVSGAFPAAARMQRALADLLGVRAGSDERGWLRHGAWSADSFPLRKEAPPGARLPAGDARYAFVQVEGDGVHEIPVGPVHAGIIEPGHFRFSVVGERVLRLEQRLGYAHKGIEKRFESMSLDEGARLAGRVSGDSTVAFAWAYA